MKYYPNIEKSGFHRGEYIGYSSESMWRITRYGSGHLTWRAIPRERGRVFYGTTLGDISSVLRTI